jgi:hypothetical protein
MIRPYGRSRIQTHYESAAIHTSRSDARASFGEPLAGGVTVAVRFGGVW